MTTFEQIEKKARTKRTALSTVTYILLVLWAIIVLFPFYWMLLTSVKSYGSYNSEYIPKLYIQSMEFSRPEYWSE